MDIFIKSFNRVYYLDRCLHSITLFLKNFNGTIYILDDGTPTQYLETIKVKYPEVIILKSNNYRVKSELIEARNYNLPQDLPSQLWYESIKKSSDYCIVLEDDIWFTTEIDITQLEIDCKKECIGLLKLLWIGNKKVIGSKEIKVTNDIVIYQPNLQFKNPFLFSLIYAKYNSLWRKALTVLGLYSREKEFNYYSIYSVAGAVFRKDYFLSIWKNSDEKVDEKKQLKNALGFSNSHRINFGRSKKEFAKTGFVSSAFSKKNYSVFTIHDFNAILNQYWLENMNLFCKDLEFDLNENEIKKILKINQKSDLYIEQWEDWMFNFKEGYRKIGCTI